MTYKITPGTIEEKTTSKVKYKAVKKPSIDAVIEKDPVYVISGINKDRMQVKKSGKYVELDENIDYSAPSFWERVKFVFSLLNHIFDKQYWAEHVEKKDYINEDEVEVLRQGADEYNALLEQYMQVAGKTIRAKDTKTYEGTNDNLDELMRRYQEFNEGK